MTTMNIYQVNAHPDMQCNEDQSQWSIACPTLNQCKIHEVFASRIQDPTRAQEWSTCTYILVTWNNHTQTKLSLSLWQVEYKVRTWASKVRSSL